eukprot:Blabericola_migrator_1__5692@NODE_288_length_10293_cov_65_527675_g237_i0_p3_GENE_NODE_288_length_10293_cov_65_527675_g237_i0NODE_288_length_10293_cov_65_527675_g237_i0_p3_ORF_typecomplete_len409_score81_14UQ_con/PF00179_26/9_4e22ProkE2_B/PF14461_6/0_0031DUF2890/PF11081_8/2_7e02DUF2890/PF11081_8/0_41zfSec23_Sec24/PF04810_15/0_1_NODE_288_length_10293_cov_65_527675_g237_i077178943
MSDPSDDKSSKSGSRQQQLDMLSSRSPDQPTGQSIRRILREWNEISTNQNPFWTASPINPDEPYEWHFTIRGPSGTAFEGGVYHGRLVLPTTYPMTPPTLFFLTPNGRFEVQKKVCLSATNFHPECWQPAWGIRLILDALHAFFPTPGEGAVHSLDWPDHSRRQLAEASKRFTCPVCQLSNQDIINANCTPLPPGATSPIPKVPDMPREVEKVEVPKEEPAEAPTSAEAPPEPSTHPAAHPATHPAAQTDPEVARLEEIRRRRTPQVSRADALARHRAFLQGMPSIFVFVYYLVYFLSRMCVSFLVTGAWRVVGTPSDRGRQIIPLHLILALVCVCVIGYSTWILVAFATRVFVETFFLFDVPIQQSFQQVTNPSPDQIRGLSTAERFEDFPLHPWIKAIFGALWAAV